MVCDGGLSRTEPCAPVLHPGKCVDGCAEVTWRGASHLQELEPDPETNGAEAEREGAPARPPATRATRQHQQRAATRRNPPKEMGLGLARGKRARRAAAGNKDRVDRPLPHPCRARLRFRPCSPTVPLPSSEKEEPLWNHLLASHLPCPASTSRYVVPASLLVPVRASRLPNSRVLLCFAPPAGEIDLLVLPGPGVCLRVRFYRNGEISRPCSSWR